MMTATKDFFVAEIKAALQKAIPLPVDSIDLKDGRLSVTLSIEGENAETLFWKAAREQSLEE